VYPYDPNTRKKKPQPQVNDCASPESQNSGERESYNDDDIDCACVASKNDEDGSVI